MQTKAELNNLNKKIKRLIKDEQIRKVRNKINPSDQSSLWKAVKIAKNISFTNLPPTISYMNMEAKDDQSKADMMMNYFEDKIKHITRSTNVTHTVYNGKRMYLNNRKYIPSTNSDEVNEILKSMNAKNSCGYDRIPMSFLVDGREELSEIIATLFNKIFNGEPIPELWKTSRIIPLYKKGSKTDANNYRPIANICSIGKVFEKWILKRINQLEKDNNISLTGNRQHGFKKQHSTQTAMLDIQNDISEQLDENNYVALVSLDLSAAFDVVNHKLLIKRLHMKGLPIHLSNLIKSWLSNRTMYVEVNMKCSTYRSIKEGTLQGSVLGPVLFAIFISPIYELTLLTTFADDNYLHEFDKDLMATIGKVKMKAELVINWLRNSGMKVNTDKTELCIFSNNDMKSITINIDNEMIISKSSINILGVTFDAKLNWQIHVDNVVRKCNRTIHAINLIKKYFTQDEKLHIVNAFLYSQMYYCSTVWLTPNLKLMYVNKLLSISAKALRIVSGDDYLFFSYNELHLMFNRATPRQWSMYQHALQLYKIFNHHIPEQIWIELCDRVAISERTFFMNIPNTNKKRVGLNKFINRINPISRRLNTNDFNMSIDSFKVKMKREFIF